MIFVIENSNKFLKPRFWKEKSVEYLVKLVGLSFQFNYGELENEFILGPMAHATLVYVVVELNIKVDLWHHRFHHINQN